MFKVNNYIYNHFSYNYGEKNILRLIPDEQNIYLATIKWIQNSTFNSVSMLENLKYVKT